jgi:hypothetical protein
VFDRDYTFDKGQEDAPKLSVKQAADLDIQSISKVTARGQEFFHINGERKWVGGRMGGRYFMACTAFGGFESRIRYMIRYTNEVDETRIPSSDLFSVSRILFTED